MGRKKIEDVDEELDEDEILEEKNTIKAVKSHIINYFEFKNSTIKTSILHNSKYIDLVKNTRIHKIIDKENIAGIDLIYKALGTSSEQKDEDIGTITDDIKLVIELYKECRSLNIPKKFSTGLIIMYLDLVEGKKVIE